MNLTHLNAAVSYRSAHGNQCVLRSAALMLDLPGATLVFGVVRAATEAERAADPRASRVPFIHAWVEYDGRLLFAPTLIERMGGELRPFAIDDYYTVNGVTRTWRLSHDDFMKVARRFKLSAAFRHGKDRAGHRDVSEALLAAAGVRYVLSERNTMLPAE